MLPLADLPHPSLAAGLEHLAIVFAAVSAVLAVRGKKLDLFGVLVLALVTSFGGGTIRDTMMGGGPVAWLGNPWAIGTAVLAALATFSITRFRAWPPAVMLVGDAFSMALFTVIGAQKALDAGAFAPPVVVLLGVSTGVGGGILRDIALGQVPVVFMARTKLYATAAIVGAILYFLLVRSAGLDAVWASVLAVAAIMGLRLMAIRWGITLPEMKE